MKALHWKVQNSADTNRKSYENDLALVGVRIERRTLTESLAPAPAAQVPLQPAEAGRLPA